MTDTTELDDELEAAARDIIAALEALERARARRSTVLAGYVDGAGMTVPATSVHARGALLDAHLTDAQIRLVGVSAPTVAQAVKVTRAARTLAG